MLAGTLAYVWYLFKVRPCDETNLRALINEGIVYSFILSLIVFSEAFEWYGAHGRDIKYVASWFLISLFMAIILLNLIYALIDLSKKIYFLLKKLWLTKINPCLQKRRQQAKKQRINNELTQ